MQFEKREYANQYDFKASEGWKKMEDSLTEAEPSKTLTLTKIPRGIRMEGVLRTDPALRADFDLNLQEELSMGAAPEWVNVDLAWDTKSSDDIQ